MWNPLAYTSVQEVASGAARSADVWHGSLCPLAPTGGTAGGVGLGLTPAL